MGDRLEFNSESQKMRKFKYVQKILIVVIYRRNVWDLLLQTQFKAYLLFILAFYLSDLSM